ncbi:hypothetical protein [Enterococcus dispar]|uniref:hypothetical protein n=1 Tax=Enterococcus dispar TaxID=44009 RepID=UPI00189C5A83|nr:hypothetical protein [Enterococcus dispar]WCG32556.1 hypothetical protein PML78_10165 [Enterococcus dispar]
MLLPSRMAVLNHMVGIKEVDVKQVMTALQKDYGNEKQFNEKMYLDHLMALEANGLVEMASYDLDQNNELVMRYAITEDGRHAVNKYVNTAYRQG